MGEKLVNFHVQAESQQDVANLITNMIRAEAYVSPVKNGWITVYDQMTEHSPQSEEIISITQELSRRLSSVAISFIVLSGIHVIYYLFDQGELMDEFHNSYNIYPFGFDETDEGIAERFQGRPEILLRYCLPGTSLQQITEILEGCKGETPNYFGTDVPYLLAPLFNLDPDRVILSFVAFEADNLQSANPLLEDAEDFIHASSASRR